MQLDIFNDSRDVMLHNDVVQALQSHDATQAQGACAALERDYPDDVNLTALHLLLRAEQDYAAPAESTGLSDHAALRLLRLTLLDQIEPAALGQMGAMEGRRWCYPLWQNLIVRAANLPFRADAESDHMAPMLLHVQAWQAAADAVARIESWRRIPAPLSWMAQAKLRLNGLRSTWPLLAELAWLSPKRLAVVADTAPDLQLPRLLAQFELALDAVETLDSALNASEKVATHADTASVLAWFPAWLLIHSSDLAEALTQAQAGQHSAPEQAMRLLLNLLTLERQGRHHDLIQQRKALRDLHPGLFAAYMKTR